MKLLPENEIPFEVERSIQEEVMGFFNFLKKLPVDEVLTAKVRSLNNEISQKKAELKDIKNQISNTEK